MQSGAILLALGVLQAAACTPTTSPDEDCIVAGGVCFRSDDEAGCYSPISEPCSTGFTCCTAAYGANIVDGALVDGPTGAPPPIVDGAVLDAGARHDGNTGAKKDSGTTSAKDGGASGSHDSGVTTKDATIAHDAGNGGTPDATGKVRDSGTAVGKDGGASADTGDKNSKDAAAKAGDSGTAGRDAAASADAEPRDAHVARDVTAD